MKLISPIPKKYFNAGTTCMITQLFGENKDSLFYGPEGHLGIDFRTVSYSTWENIDWFWTEETDKRVKYSWGGNAKVKRAEANEMEYYGRIPIQATHDGTVTLSLNPEKQRVGWGLWLTADPVVEDGIERQYKSLFWHIETPWFSMDGFSGVIKTISELLSLFTGKKVRAGTPIAIGGNNGQSTGPHCHYQYYVREKRNGVWGIWRTIDPMPYFDEHDVLYQTTNEFNTQFFYRGEEISEKEATRILTKFFPKITK